MKKILLLDASNCFFKAYAANPTIDSTGKFIGGTVGFIKSFKKMVLDISPDAIFVVYDSAGGSKRRRSFLKTYKDGRKSIAVHKNYNLEQTSDELLRNKLWQLNIIVDFLSYCPVFQFLLEDIEADDIIAYIKNMQEMEDFAKIIVSSDKDFIQLIDNRTLVYRTTQNELLNIKRTIDKFGIHPNNFVLSRAICGDRSDNIEGVGGVGMVTVAKKFPFLKEQKPYFIEEIEQECRKRIDNGEKNKIYQNILNNLNKIENNCKIMQLDCPIIGQENIDSIKKILKERVIFDKIKLLKIMMQNSISISGIEELFSFFSILEKRNNFGIN